MEFYLKKISHMTSSSSSSPTFGFIKISSFDTASYLSSINKETTSILFKKFRSLFNLNVIKSTIDNRQDQTHTQLPTVDQNSLENKQNSNSLLVKNFYNQDNLINFLHYYYQNNYNTSIIYYNNLLLAIIVLFVLFSILILLEENDSFYNISAISFLLFITFNLVVIIFSHNLTKQFVIQKNYFYY
jgi:hypothetical protein